jgi:hypothetical protein
VGDRQTVDFGSAQQMSSLRKDLTLYILKALSYLGIVWDLQTPPQKIFAETPSGELAG